jgi:hypothetical protein
MDDKSTQLLEELVILQKKQNELLGRHLTRIKFSLWSLFLLMTFICLGLGAAFVATPKQSRTTPLPIPPMVAPAPRVLAPPMILSPPPTAPEEDPFG